MSTTLSNGFVKPEVGNKGGTLFTFLSANWVKVNDHTHNGSNSEQIATSDLNKGSVAVTAASWTLDANSGMYRKSFTFPGDHTHGSSVIRAFFDGGTYDGQEVQPTIEKINSTSAYIYSPTNSQAFDLVFV